ncbi:MAG: phosphoadenylyl-sulfate reductase [Alphaproteobacteria bacterium]|nr:phosphoadenylyl-sulfate reductase [Alphaproteobacteria bacterium]
MTLATRLPELQARYADFDAEALIRAFAEREFPGKIALVSSFGAEAALLLDMVARIKPSMPVIFLDTGKLFPETLAYRDTLIAHLGLENVKTYYPDYIDVSRDDPEGGLWAQKPSDCCYIRKVKPLHKALKGYDCWITGRKRLHGGDRAVLPLIEFFEGQIKINPLANWSMDRITETYTARKLPEHPLVAQGYTSLGCLPCTSLPSSAADPRSGRWAGQEKTECGIHLGKDGKFQRS